MASSNAAKSAQTRIVKLNVGGCSFSTARSTLETCTFFQRLLSDEFSDLDDNGEAFIDRDGRYFHFVLNFLRSGAVELPEPPLTLEGVIAEAEYFGVGALADAVRHRARPEDHPIGEEPPMPEVKADGTGIYVWEDVNAPGMIECVLFEAGSRPGFGHGTCIYSRGPCARENLLALRSMPRPLPNLWRYVRARHFC